MAILFRGMNKREVSTLTDVMEHSGETIDLSEIQGIKVDKHSTGGVGDKTTMVLGPMVAACGAKLAKLSGRGLGHTGGTIDKLESIPGCTVAIEGQRFIDQVNNIGIAVVGQTQSLVPADKLLYALRDVTGTVESIPLIASSVMSKKLASGSDAILLDVTVGEGAFMKNMDSARELAHTMVGIGNSLGRNTIAVLSDMGEPLGKAVGNSLEIKEAINALQGNGPEDLMELCYTCGSIMLVQANVAKDEIEGRQMLEEAIKSGRAFNKFVEMIKAQEGDINYILHPELFEVSKNVIEIFSDEQGYVEKLNALEIGLSAMRLGGGRETKEDNIDMSAGIILNKKIGDQVSKDELLATIYTNKDKNAYEPILMDIKQSFKIVDHFVESQPVIREIIKE